MLEGTRVQESLKKKQNLKSRAKIERDSAEICSRREEKIK